MKTSKTRFPQNAFLLSALIAGFSLIAAGPVTAQIFTTLHSFVPSTDGRLPKGRLLLSGNTLYGTTAERGSFFQGTVFKINTDGTGFQVLRSFQDNSIDGARPAAGLILSGDMLYGTTFGGGSVSAGTIFKMRTDGTDFTLLHSFGAWDGTWPRGALVLSGDTLYGTTMAGYDSGTVFAVKTNGTGFTNLHVFNSYAGAHPQSTLVISSNILYGTTSYGGFYEGNGTVFAIKTDGTGFTNLHQFTAFIDNTNSDGGSPIAGLILSGNTLYGTAERGGSSGQGTVFAVNTDGTGFTNLHNFPAASTGTNSDGATPRSDLFLRGNTLFGTAPNGGAEGGGTVFALNTDGTGFINLHSFPAAVSESSPNSDGANPTAGLTLSGNVLYGTAGRGGTGGAGTVFSLSFAPQLTIIRSGANVLLTWPTNVAGFDYTGFTVQSTTNLVPPAVWTSNSPPPTVVNGQNTVTNPASGAQKFYRLSQ